MASSTRLRPAPPPGDFDAEEGLSFETSKGVKVVNSFEAMKIRDPLLRGVYAFGFEKPSAIQQRAILPITQGERETLVLILVPCTRDCDLHQGLHVMLAVGVFCGAAARAAVHAFDSFCS